MSSQNRIVKAYRLDYLECCPNCKKESKNFLQLHQDSSRNSTLFQCPYCGCMFIGVKNGGQSDIEVDGLFGYLYPPVNSVMHNFY